LIREINLDSSIDGPMHCFELSTGDFVVSHYGRGEHRVCVVNTCGHIMQSYGRSYGLGVGQLRYPSQLCIDVHDNVLVADFGNCRVQLLSPTLTHLGDLVTPGYQLNQPVLHFDDLNHRLYIGEENVGRILILDDTV